MTQTQKWADEAMRLKDENVDLQAVNARLLKSLKRILPMVGSPHGHTIGDVWQAQEQARAAIKAATEE